MASTVQVERGQFGLVETWENGEVAICVFRWRGTESHLPTVRDVSFFLHVAPEIIEDTNEVAIKIGGHKLA
jgi:hypothetical protein